MDLILDESIEHWTLEQGLSVVRELEKTVSKCGYHTGLVGSVLHKGASTKDLDIVVYPHSTELQPRRECMAQLEIAGVKWIELRDHAKYGDDKLVWEGKFKNKRVDFFFLV